MKKAIILSLSLLLFFSCAVEKRKYQKGFYVSWNRSSSRSDARTPHIHPPQAAAQTVSPLREAEPGGTASTGKDSRQLRSLAPESTGPAMDGPALQQMVFTKDSLKKDRCDELIFNDGTEAKGKVTEITPTEIKYKKCDMPDGPVYVVRKSDVFMVRYANGEKEIFSAQKNTQPQTATTYTSPNVPDKMHPLAIASGIMAGMFMIPFVNIITSILAIIFGHIAIARINAKPDVYEPEGKDLAIVGIILGWL